MDAIFEYRNSSRVFHEATVMIETRDGGNLHYATMYNFSGDGMYCGSDSALKQGTAITIRLNSLPFKAAPKIYLGEVRRCEVLEGDDNSHLYGLGIKIIKAIYS
jgi:hypothetical protein